MKTLFLKQRFSLIKKFTKEDVILFSRLSGDLNPIHLDDEYCKNTIFKYPICHGMLGSSLFSNLMGNNLNGSIYLSQTLRFIKPVYIDEEIEAIVEINQYLKEKNMLKLNTYVIKMLSNEMAIDGEALIKIPKDIYNFDLK